ncbi:MAG: UDP-3-O-[3-hydroxymyristoyl] N-acetylglucosamine deacetylase [Candidatus Omnitrophica bacterium]|nr:UDP-3-O-[3-hydroxymyristoyl] N-acetylglucosamine deacetylase [Candidatus Omnitrophota bacterium]MBI5145478.1 UDP-3-O-[3-hydroxymyristoyl] N-acetylglucosamine deacetylase [Candidatus Omnitrophota bacterium]
MDKQRTIQHEATLKGVGLHTAKKVNLTFKPAELDSGINFIRTDIDTHPVIKATIDNLMPQSPSLRRTSIGKDDVALNTIEHLMAVLSGLGIDNLCIEIDNDEVPGLDGSGLNFLEILTKAGIKEQEKERRYYFIKEPLYVEEEGVSLAALPSNEFKISYTLNYNNPFIDTQFMDIKIDSQTFKDEIASARTFCLEDEVAELQAQGLGRGANYENTLVVGEKGVIKNKLRFSDEFIRHKILDLVGDLYLLGEPIKGHVIALRSGHSLNLKLLQKINQQRKRYALGGVGASYHPPEEEVLDADMIMKILPHRPPFLFVDKIISLTQGKRAVGVKNLAPDDYFFKGHFPGRPVMPGVLIIEAMAQVGGVMMLAPQEHRGKLAFFLAINNAKFRKTVLPGDQLILEVEAGRIKSKTGQVHAKALVDGKIVAEADLMFALV